MRPGRAGDWARYLVEGAGPANAVPDGYGGWYCVYAGRSGATGGIEFDIFPSATEAEAEEVYRTVREGPLVMAFSVPEVEGIELGLLSLAVVVAERYAQRK